MGKVSEKRLARVRSLLLRTLSELIASELVDPRIGLFSLTDLQLSADMSYADVKVSVVGGQQATEECCKVLQAASPLLRNRLRRETDLRMVPSLRFAPDMSGVYEDEINELLKTIPPAADPSPAGEER